MLHMQIFSLGSLATGVAHFPPSTRARTRWVLMGVLFVFLFGLAGASAARPQEREREREREQERASDWATDYLELVSASPEQIRDVLAKDPGLMVELKRLMAKQAIDKGQIVGEQELADAAIMDRLATDTRFRALATRLLQRYGYLSPQLNPQSPPGKEQDMLLKARAERLARATTDLGPESGAIAAECGSGRGTPGCMRETSGPTTGLGPESEPSAS